MPCVFIEVSTPDENSNDCLCSVCLRNCLASKSPVILLSPRDVFPQFQSFTLCNWIGLAKDIKGLICRFLELFLYLALSYILFPQNLAAKLSPNRNFGLFDTSMLVFVLVLFPALWSRNCFHAKSWSESRA